MDSAIVTRDPEIMSGTLCFAGTRVPVKNLFDYLEGSSSLEEFLGVRRTLLPRFPYGVFYTVKNDLVYVLAVIHHARQPRRWPQGRNP